MNATPFQIEMEVRDYECDMEGIVNNAVYLNYLEHARHGFLHQKGLTFKDWITQGIQLVVYRIEADYLYPLRSGDKFYVTARAERISKLRFGFPQEIYRLPDGKPIMRARVLGTSLNANGQPKYFEEVEKLFR
jgi:acyl-CoA thioester hydrolase